MKTSEDYMLTSENHLLTLEDYLEKDAALFPDKVAITCGEESCTYRQLWNRVTDTAASFHSPYDRMPRNIFCHSSLRKRGSSAGTGIAVF